MKVAKSITSYLLVLVVLALLVTAMLIGADLGPLQIPKVIDQNTITGVRQGFDLVGGTRIVYKAEIPETVTPQQAEIGLDRMANMFTERTSRIMGVMDGSAQRIGSSNMVQVFVPNQLVNGTLNTGNMLDEYIAALGRQSLATLEDADGNVILSGADIINATPYGPVAREEGQLYYMVVDITEAGRQALIPATQQIAGLAGEGKNTMTFRLDGVEVRGSTVDPQYVASGMDTKQLSIPIEYGETGRVYADYLSKALRGGTMPFTYTIEQIETVEPALGAYGFRNLVLAGIIAVALIVLFMLIYYKAPGFVAVVGFGIYLASVALIMATYMISLTLPGIIAVVLAGGLLVLSNVAMFERVKAEIKGGNTPGSAVRIAYKNTIKPVLDMHVIALLVSVVLMVMGSSPIKDFATMMLWGVLLSFAIVWIVTGLLLKGLAGLRVKSSKSYGV